MAGWRERGVAAMQRGGSLGLQRSFLTFIFHSQHNFTGLASPQRAHGYEFRYLGARAPRSYRLTSCPSGSARPSRERSHHSLHADDDRQRVATRRRDIQPHCVMSLVRPRWIIRSCAIARPRGRTGDQPGAQEVVRGCVRAFATNGTIRFRARQHMGKVALAAPALVEPPWPMLYGAR